MATNLKIDDGLLAEALKLGGLKTKRETVNCALQEFVARRKQRKIIALKGSIDYLPDYDYKEQRRLA